MQYSSNAVPTPFPSFLCLFRSPSFPGKLLFTFLEAYLPPPVTPPQGLGPQVPLGPASASSGGPWVKPCPDSLLAAVRPQAAGPARAASLEGRAGEEEAGGPLGPGGAGAGPGRGGRQGDAPWRVRAGFLVRQRERFRGGQSRGPATKFPRSKEKGGQGNSSRPPPESVVTVLRAGWGRGVWCLQGPRVDGGIGIEEKKKNLGDLGK